MPPRRLRNLIIGLALTFVGPALGFTLYLLLVFCVFGNMADPTASLPDLMAQARQIPARVFLCLIPLGLGFLCGATGFVIVLANLATHFLGQPPATSAPSGAWPPSPAQPSAPHFAQPAPAVPSHPDSRYMPKAR